MDIDNGEIRMNKVHIPISIGELIDKISILFLKQTYIKDPDKLLNIEHELEMLENFLNVNFPDTLLDKITVEMSDLHKINKKIWITEDELRKIEENGGPFKSKFIKLARSIYTDNDQRARIKKSINLKTDSSLIEEKSHGGIDIKV